MSVQPAATSALPPAVVASLRPLVQRWWPAAALLGGGWLVAETSLQVTHWLSSGSSFTLAAAAGGALWLLRPRRPGGLAETNLTGWLQRLETLLPQFETLAGNDGGRSLQLSALREQLARSGMQVAVVGMAPVEGCLQEALPELLQGPSGLTLHWAEPLPRWSGAWRWPTAFQQCDLLLHRLQIPLTAAELRWLEAMPEGQPAWLLVSVAADQPGGDDLRQELAAQLPPRCDARLMLWNGELDSLPASLEPLRQGLLQEELNWRQHTRLRLARGLHRQWQAELEVLRRERLEGLLQRTQWVVGAGVFAAPLPSLDLLVLAVANGLMLQEMARLWQCPWTLEHLRTAAAELARASLALGVVEWSSQSLAGLLKLHGATWLVGGAVQALSAAYLTRVVGRAMADVLALSSGVDAFDLERLKREAPLIVARAAEAERLDWQAFLQQGRQWLREQAA